MADVTIKYKGATIAEMSGTSEKTLETGGTYCEDDIGVVYAPRSKTYEITLAQASRWVLLTTLDEDVLAHINDASLVVSLSCIDAYEYVRYALTMAICSNTPIGMQNTYSIYGGSFRTNTSTGTYSHFAYYPANKTDTNRNLGGVMFRVSGGKYYIYPLDGYVKTGTYRLTFTW